MKKLFFFFLFLLILANQTLAIPELPMIITGTALINEKSAKEIEITAKVRDTEIANVKTNENGEFTLLLQKLQEDEEIKVYVDGIDSLETIKYKGGDYKQLSLKVEKSYWMYYLGGLIAIAAIVVIWKLKKH